MLSQFPNTSFTTEVKVESLLIREEHDMKVWEGAELRPLLSSALDWSESSALRLGLLIPATCCLEGPRKTVWMLRKREERLTLPIIGPRLLGRSTGRLSPNTD